MSCSWKFVSQILNYSKDLSYLSPGHAIFLHNLEDVLRDGHDNDNGKEGSWMSLHVILLPVFLTFCRCVIFLSVWTRNLFFMLWENYLKFFKLNHTNIFKVPEVPKKVVLEEKVTVAVPKKPEPPSLAKGTSTA